jgi:hypothetical protein
MKINILFHNIQRKSAIDSNAVNIMLLEIFVFVIPMLKFVKLSIEGRLILSEIILFVLFLFMLSTKNIRFETKMGRTLIVLCILWMYGQILTDIIRSTDFIDYVRGWAKVFFTIVNFVTIYSLFRNRRRLIVIFAAGIAAGNILEFYLNPGILAHNYPWKFGIGSSVTLLFILIAESYFRKRNLFSIVPILIISSLNLILGFRSLSGICFLPAVYLALQWLWSTNVGSKFQLSLKTICIVATIILAASTCFVKGYGYLANRGYLGEGAKIVYEGQAYGMLGLIIGGRSEILTSWNAIMDSPIIGHGSWAKNEQYAEALIEIKRLLGYYAGEPDETGLIPTHSHIFGAWVEAGVLGAIFWFWVILLPIRCIMRLFGTKECLTPLFAYICFLLMWDIFFSPYSGDRRFITPYYMVSLIAVLEGINQDKYSSP